MRTQLLSLSMFNTTASKPAISNIILDSESLENRRLKPCNFEERVVWYGIIGIYAMYFTGTLVIGVPVMAWILFAHTLKKIFLDEKTGDPDNTITVPLGVWVWIICTLVIGVALVVGHYELGLGLRDIIKAVVNSFARKWIFFIIFPLAGCLNIRPKIIYRAVCLLACQSLILLPVILLLQQAGVEAPLYVNTIVAKIGGDVRYFSVSLYTGQRLLMFAPWAPALAMIANIHLWIAYSESNKFLKWTTIVTCVILTQMSESRLGTLLLISLPFVRYFATNMLKARTQIALAGLSLTVGLFSFQVQNLISDFRTNFRGQRADSSRVRDLLESMTSAKIPDRPIWGHAFLQPKGPQIVAEMQIGSHHTWYGILYMHGIVGFVGLFIAMAYTTIELFIRSQHCQIAQTAFMVMLVLIAFTFGENIEGLAYLYWPGLILFGIALKQP